MKAHEFFRKYANTPLGDRFTIINFQKGGLKTLSDVYQKLKRIGDEIRPQMIEQKKLLELAEIFFRVQSKKRS